MRSASQRTRRLFAAAVSICACLLLWAVGRSEQAPEEWKFNIEGTKYLIPSRKVWMRYEGEDDWHTNEVPWHRRTFADPLGFIEFHLDLLDLNHVPDDAVYRAAIDQPLRGKNGRWVGITISAEQYQRLAKRPGYRPRVDEELASARRMPDEQGFARFRLRRNENDVSDTDALLSEDRKLWFVCDDDRDLNGIDRAGCEMTSLDDEMRVLIVALFDRRDISRWRDIRDAASGALLTWQVKRQRL